MNEFDRISQHPELMGGKACIRGMRVTVGNIVGQIGAGQSIDEVLVDYPYLERDDVLQALRFAAWRAEEREVVCWSLHEADHRHEPVAQVGDGSTRSRL